MENKDVQAVLNLLGLDTIHDSSQMEGSASVLTMGDRAEVISRLMNITLHCLGTIRKLVIEDEKARISMDCTDIDGSQRDSGEVSMVQRQVFAVASKTLVDTIITGKELLSTDPMKDLIDSYPWVHSLTTPHWLMLNWSLMEGHVSDTKSPSEHIESVRQVLKFYPDCLAEVDKVGQHYMTYVMRTQSLEMLEEMLHYHREGVGLPDAKGRRAIHYLASYGQSVEGMVVLSHAARKPLAQLLLGSLDDYGNTPLHLAAGGICSLDVLKEILYSAPDAARMRNNDGMLPLHVAAGKGITVEGVKALVTAYPSGISATDRNQWLPLQHAAYDQRSVEIVQYLHESYPAAIAKPHASSGRLPLHYAAVKCLSSKVLAYLLSANPAAVDAFDVHRRLPLHNCIARCEPGGMTPVRLRCLRLLLEAYPSAAGMADEDGRTPLDLARRDMVGPLVMRLLLRADPGQDPEALADIAFRASKAKYRDRDRERARDRESDRGDRESDRGDSKYDEDGASSKDEREFGEMV